MSDFINPEMLQQMDLGEKLGYSLFTMVQGMGITFIVLILLMVAIKIMGAVLNPKKKESVIEEPVEISNDFQEPVLLHDEEDNEELVAVITAALIAMQGGRGKKLRLQSIRRTGESIPLWSQSGMNQNMRDF